MDEKCHYRPAKKDLYGQVPYVPERNGWDRSHIYLGRKHGTGPIGLCEPCTGLFDWKLSIHWSFVNFFNLKSHILYGTGPIGVLQQHMGPVPYMHERHVWDRSHIELSDTYGTSPIHKSEISMGPVPCCVLRHLWDRSHVWFPGTYGTGPIPHMGLQNITSIFQQSLQSKDWIL